MHKKQNIIIINYLIMHINLAFNLSFVVQCMNSQSISFGSGAYSIYKYLSCQYIVFPYVFPVLPYLK